MLFRSHPLAELVVLVLMMYDMVLVTVMDARDFILFFAIVLEICHKDYNTHSHSLVPYYGEKKRRLYYHFLAFSLTNEYGIDCGF